MVARPCLDCQRATRNGSRCPTCAQAHDQRRDQRRGTAAQRGYGYRWQRLSQQVIERDGGICHLCGKPGADTADHVTPKASGGSDDPSNLRAAHRACNSAKGAGRLVQGERRAWQPESRSPVFVRRSRSLARLAGTSVVHVCGQPGSGKSWLASALSTALAIPALSIDEERIHLLRPGESWPENDGLAWCALEDRLNNAGRAIVETSGLHGNDVILLGGRRVYRIVCRAATVTRTARLLERVRTGYALIGDQHDYVARLLRLPEPKLPVNLAVDTSRNLTDADIASVTARVGRFLDGRG